MNERSPRWIRLSWSRRDEYPWVTGFALVGLILAAALATVGLPPIDLHGPLHHLGIMDPLCGGTRAARFTMLGRWDQAWRYNPLGPMVVLGAGAVLVRAIVGAASGRWLTATWAWTRRRRRATLALAVVLIAVLEVRQQLLVDLLR